MASALPSDPLGGTVAIGEVIAEKYRVERVLGVGGMGVVVRAMHLELDEPVALKLLLPEALKNAEAVARFAREARAAVKIKSEHVARVLDVGKLANGAPFIVMEFLSGEELGALLQRAPPSLEEAVGYILQACEAVAEAHALGIVHRDLKPGNLFITRRTDGTASVKVLDFGISKVAPSGARRADDAATRTSAVMGTPLYMSPEQLVSARQADARSDIWALGAILYELIAGVPPFDGEELPQICTAILHTQPASMVRAGLPPALERAILRCLEKEPARRFADLAELANALAPFGGAEARTSADRIARVLATSGLRPAAETVLAISGPPTNGAWTVSRPRRSSRATFALFAIAFIGVSVLGAAVMISLARRPDPTPASVAEPSMSKPPPTSSATPVQVVAASTSAAASATAVATVDPAPSTSASVARPTALPRPRGAPAKTTPLFRDRN